MSEDRIVFFIMTGVGVLFAALALPLIMRKVPPNNLYGVRTKATLENEELWFEANRYFGKQILVGGILLTVSGTAAWIFVPEDKNGIVTFGLLVIMLASLLIAGIRCSRFCSTFRSPLPRNQRPQGH